MKGFITILLFLFTTLGFSQSGVGYLNYKSYKTHYGTGASSTYNGVTYDGSINDGTELSAVFDVNQPGTTLTHSGEVVAYSSAGTVDGLAPRWNDDYYAVSYTGWIQAKETGQYRFSLASDDSSELFIDGNIVISLYGCCRTEYGYINLVAGEWYSFEARYQEYGGGQYMRVLFLPPSGTEVYLGVNTNSIEVSNIEPIPTLSVNFDFDFGPQLDITKLVTKMKVKKGYTSTSYNFTTGLETQFNPDGTVDMTPQMNSNLVSTGGNKATSTAGTIEWCVVYDYDTTNKRYRVGIDKREFVNGLPDPTTVNSLQLFDLWDGPVTFSSQDTYWANYYIYTDTQLDFTNSSYSANIRDGGSYHALRAEFLFEEGLDLLGHKIDFYTPLTTDYSVLYDEIVTVSDVYTAFQALTSNDINGNQSGTFTHGIQYMNADVDLNKVFDFRDTFKLMQHLQGISLLAGTPPILNASLKIYTESEYDEITTSNWNTQKNTTSFVWSFPLDKDNLTHQFNMDLAFKGDVNLSHSSVPSSQTTTLKNNNITTSKNNISTAYFVTEKIGDEIKLTIQVSPNGNTLSGLQFKVNYDNTRLKYKNVEYETPNGSTNFGVDKGSYINVGSILTNGVDGMGNVTKFSLWFTPNGNINDILGLITVSPTDAITINGEQITIIMI